MASNCCSLLAEIDLLLKTLKGPALSLSRITLPSMKQKIKTLVMLHILPLSETILYLFEGELFRNKTS